MDIERIRRLVADPPSREEITEALAWLANLTAEQQALLTQSERVTREVNSELPASPPTDHLSKAAARAVRAEHNALIDMMVHNADFYGEGGWRAEGERGLVLFVRWARSALAFNTPPSAEQRAAAKAALKSVRQILADRSKPAAVARRAATAEYDRARRARLRVDPKDIAKAEARVAAKECELRALKAALPTARGDAYYDMHSKITTLESVIGKMWRHIAARKSDAAAKL